MADRHHSAQLHIIKGHLERITYYNDSNHYLIARFRSKEQNTLITVLGTMPGPNLGESLQLHGEWETHPQYGQQFRFKFVEVLLPSSVEGIKKYLSSGFIKGLGPKMVSRIVHRFGDRTLEVIEDHPQQLTQVSGIGTVMAERIESAWRKHHAIRGIMRFLQDNDIPTFHCARLFKEYGSDTLDILQQDPYRVAQDIPRIGFLIADTIVRNSDISVDYSQRAQACVLYLLEQYVDEGHVFVLDQKVISQCERVFNIDIMDSEHAISVLAEKQEIYQEAIDFEDDVRAIYLPELYSSEANISNRLKAMLSVPISKYHLDKEELTQEILKKLAIQLSEEQLDALQGILAHRVAIVTGGPGTGKTTLIRAITAIYEGFRRKIVLAAPTGRAARRMSELTGKDAYTIHRLLRYNVSEGYFEKDQNNLIDADAIIIDEASMVDVILMNHLVNAIPLTSNFLMVGDVFQLPSVGPGNVLGDLIDSKVIKTFELSEIFRQKKKSTIVLNAHKARSGVLFDLDRNDALDGRSDFCFLHQTDPEKVVNLILELCKYRIPDRFGLNPIRDIQVLTPMHKGVIGTINLNKVLQDSLNPKKSHISASGYEFRINDKVMHLKNNYQKAVFNGDIGSIVKIDSDSATLTVNYDGRHVDYDSSELDELALAYAVSVHKSQGSEYPAVIVPIMTQHYVMLQRNLLYTALTRGKQLVVFIGTPRAVEIALKNDKPYQRQTTLTKRLTS